MNLEALLAARLSAALTVVAGRPADPVIRASQHADFQSNAVLALAHALRRPPREVAAEVVAAADLSGLAAISVSGPGFLNLTVDDDFLASAAAGFPEPPPAGGERIVLDYSGPNVAKEMHVGNLRSTIIGDALARILEWQGHDVVRVNHLGDWGTQFGMLIEYLVDTGEGSGHSLGDLTRLYRQARARFDSDEDFQRRARRRVVALQGGDPLSRELWQRLVAQSEEAFMDAYRRLGVTLRPDDFVGESFYQDQLPSVLDELGAKGLLVESEGALCAFPPGFAGREGEPLPLLVRKSDGGFGYAATDLAAVRYRVRELKADRLLYVVGTPQSTHFAMVFAVARMAGWLTPEVPAEHVDFGSVLGTDGKMLRTRAGASVKLSGLLDEADARASSHAVGTAAIKYADLSSDRRSDYVFDWDRMLASTGNTGPYLQYAYARIRSMFQRAGDDAATGGPVVLGEPAERALALALLGFEPAVRASGDRREPHRLAAYLHDLAAAFSVFYENCPVLRSEGATRASRLALADRTARTLERGLTLLGIELPSSM
ncbi:arginine--tRNA ligase [Actinoplanes sp. NPDC051411]|uniref:arginine--tRNA ligase n=1 Tax=Actinoplanes sp. NPDC051411 TaxID=3155522 RepID=UPI003427A416